jgi:rod shape-determining protein MreC
MRYLIAFLIRNSFFFLFLILEIFSISLMLHYNKYQSSVFVNASASITGEIYHTFDNINAYFNLKAENQKLATENSQLRNQLKSSVRQTDTNFYFQDSIYRYTDALVINKSTKHKNNYLMLNKGLKHGINKNMGVISDRGVVGVIVGVSENFSIAMPLIHQHSKLSALIKKNAQLVNIAWSGEDYQIGLIEDIPMHIQLSKGDSIITSGYSFFYPKGIFLGTVKNYKIAKGQTLNVAELQYAVDFNNLTNVYIIENLKKTELEQLMEGQNDD